MFKRKYKCDKRVSKKSIDINKIKYKIFSDNLYLSISYDNNKPYDLDESIWLCLYISQLYQQTMLKNGVLVRGGISIGEDYCDDDIIFSPAMIEAYEIESKVANFPRIVLDNKIVDSIKSGLRLKDFMVSSIENSIIYDWLNIHFLNPVIPISLDNVPASDLLNYKASIEVYYKNLLDFIINELEKARKSGDMKVIEKNLWNYNFISWIIGKKNAQFEKEYNKHGFKMLEFDIKKI